jgi:hypothetical protein
MPTYMFGLSVLWPRIAFWVDFDSSENLLLPYSELWVPSNRLHPHIYQVVFQSRRPQPECLSRWKTNTLQHKRIMCVHTCRYTYQLCSMLTQLCDDVCFPVPCDIELCFNVQLLRNDWQNMLIMMKCLSVTSPLIENSQQSTLHSKYGMFAAVHSP